MTTIEIHIGDKTMRASGLDKSDYLKALGAMRLPTNLTNSNRFLVTPGAAADICKHLEETEAYQAAPSFTGTRLETQSIRKVAMRIRNAIKYLPREKRD